MKEEYIYSAQAAWLLKRTIREIQSMVAQGKLTATNIYDKGGKKKLLIHVDSVEQLFYKTIRKYEKVYNYLNLSEREKQDYWNNIDVTIKVRLETTEYLSLKQISYLLNVTGQKAADMIEDRWVDGYMIPYKGRDRKFVSEISLARYMQRELTEQREKFINLINYINTDNKSLYWDKYEENVLKISEADNKRRTRYAQKTYPKK